ncbi:MAG: PPOX class F420-dependent oxidoreductase [Dehalococcoidia bacterium]|nr:PPOX class F420-dependent oxidoreductase [Dehalococcoidia bacterium]
MAASLSAKASELFNEPNLVHLATLMADGSSQVSPVWVEYDNGSILINTALGRIKPKNLDRDKRVALSLVDRNNAYRAVIVRGSVVEMTETGADAHIDKLAKKYLGVDSYPGRSAIEKRVIVRIQPERVSEMGLD